MTRRLALLAIGTLLGILVVWLSVWFLPERSLQPPPEPEVETSSNTSPLRGEAMQLADRIVEDFPGTPEALYLRGLVLNRFGSSYAAVQCWQQCIEMVPEFADCYYWIGWDALRRGEYEEAISRFRRALELQPELPNVRLRLAEALTNSGQPAEAIAVLEEHVAGEATRTEGFFRLGQAYAHAGRYQEAVKAYQRALNIDPDCSNAWFGLAQSHARLGDMERARELLKKFQELKKEQFAAGQEQKRQYDDVGQLGEGLADAYMLAARLYQVRDRHSEAIAAIERAAQLEPENPKYARFHAELVGRSK